MIVRVVQAGRFEVERDEPRISRRSTAAWCRRDRRRCAGAPAAAQGRLVLAWFAEVEVAFLRGVFGGSDRWWRRRTIDVAGSRHRGGRCPIG